MIHKMSDQGSWDDRIYWTVTSLICHCPLLEWATVKDDVLIRQKIHPGFPIPCSPSFSRAPRYSPSAENICTHELLWSQTKIRLWLPSTATPLESIASFISGRKPLLFHSHCPDSRLVAVMPSLPLTAKKFGSFSSFKWQISTTPLWWRWVTFCRYCGGLELQSNHCTRWGILERSRYKRVVAEAAQRAPGSWAPVEWFKITFPNLFASRNSSLCLFLK